MNKICTSFALMMVSLPALSWTYTDIGTLGGNYSLATAINNKSSVVGEADNAVGKRRAFLYKAGVMKDLGSLGGANGTSVANRINDKNVIVGSSTTSSGDTHAFLWTSCFGMQDIGTLGGDYSNAFAINNKNVVVGESKTASGELHAFRWEKGVMTDLGVFTGNFSSATDINDFGVIVGKSCGNNQCGVFDKRAVIWKAGKIINIGNLGWGSSGAAGINAKGDVVFHSNASGVDMATAIYRNGSIIPIGTPSLSTWAVAGYAHGINDKGHVIGMYDYENYSYFWEGVVQGVFSKVGPPVASPFRKLSLFTINNLDQSVGRGTYPDGRVRAVLVSP